MPVLNFPLHIFNFLELFLALWVFLFQSSLFLLLFWVHTSLTVFFFSKLLFPKLSLCPPRSAALLVNLGTSLSCCCSPQESDTRWLPLHTVISVSSGQIFLLQLCWLVSQKTFLLRGSFLGGTSQQRSQGMGQKAAVDPAPTAKVEGTLLQRWRNSATSLLGRKSFLLLSPLYLLWSLELPQGHVGYFTPRPSSHPRNLLPQGTFPSSAFQPYLLFGKSSVRIATSTSHLSAALHSDPNNCPRTLFWLLNLAEAELRLSLLPLTLQLFSAGWVLDCGFLGSFQCQPSEEFLLISSVTALRKLERKKSSLLRSDWSTPICVPTYSLYNLFICWTPQGALKRNQFAGIWFISKGDVNKLFCFIICTKCQVLC